MTYSKLCPKCRQPLEDPRTFKELWNDNIRTVRCLDTLIRLIFGANMKSIVFYVLMNVDMLIQTLIPTNFKRLRDLTSLGIGALFIVVPYTELSSSELDSHHAVKVSLKIYTILQLQICNVKAETQQGINPSLKFAAYVYNLMSVSLSSCVSSRFEIFCISNACVLMQSFMMDFFFTGLRANHSEVFIILTLLLMGYAGVINQGEAEREFYEPSTRISLAVMGIRVLMYLLSKKFANVQNNQVVQ